MTMPQATEFKILGLGTVTVDHVLTVARYPERDSKNEAINSRYQVGGPVPTALSQLRRFGYAADLLSIWGDDAWGDVIEHRLLHEEIGFQSACRKNLSTSVTQIWLEEETGQRTLVTSRVNGSSLDEMVNPEIINQFDVLHLDCWPTDAALKAAKLMKQSGGIVCLDTGSPKPKVEELLKLADVVNCPKRFCADFLGKTDLVTAALRIAALGPRYVTVTDGENGAVLCTQGQIYVEPALDLAHIADTNGAGDSFSGALIHAVLQKWSPKKILKFAVTCSGLKCLQVGNSESLPSESDVFNTMAMS